MVIKAKRLIRKTTRKVRKVMRGGVGEGEIVTEMINNFIKNFIKGYVEFDFICKEEQEIVGLNCKYNLDTAEDNPLFFIMDMLKKYHIDTMKYNDNGVKYELKKTKISNDIGINNISDLNNIESEIYIKNHYLFSIIKNNNILYIVDANSHTIFKVYNHILDKSPEKVVLNKNFKNDVIKMIEENKDSDNMITGFDELLYNYLPLLNEEEREKETIANMVTHSGFDQEDLKNHRGEMEEERKKKEKVKANKIKIVTFFNNKNNPPKSGGKLRRRKTRKNKKRNIKKRTRRT